MDENSLDTKLHTRFAIFLYTYRLETAMLTRRVYLDAADAERCARNPSCLLLLSKSAQASSTNSQASNVNN